MPHQIATTAASDNHHMPSQVAHTVQKPVLPNRHARSVSSVFVMVVLFWSAQINFNLGFMATVSTRKVKDKDIKIIKQTNLDQPEIQGDYTTRLKVGGTTKVGALARVLTVCATNGSLAATHARCLGANTSVTALNAVVLANSNIMPSNTDSSDTVVPEQIVLLPSTVTAMIKGEKKIVRDLHFQLKAVGPMPASANDNLLKVSDRTDPGKLARTILNRIDMHGEAVLTAAGETPIGKVLHATVIAQSWSDEETNQSGKLACLPTFFNMPPGLKGLQLRCFKI